MRYPGMGAWIACMMPKRRRYSFIFHTAFQNVVKRISRLFQLRYVDRTGSLHDFYAVLILIQHTALPRGSVWPSPGKEPREDVVRAIVIAVHDESTVLATIRPFPQRHVLEMATPTTHL